MKTAVLDTNVLASGFVRANPAAAPTQILNAWQAQRFVLVVSETIITELARTLGKPYFRQRLSDEIIAADVALLRGQASVTPITTSVSGIATHPEDDAILATAVSARADYLVTGDGKLQQLGTYEGVTLLSPRAYMAMLEAPEDDTEP